MSSSIGLTSNREWAGMGPNVRPHLTSGTFRSLSLGDGFCFLVPALQFLRFDFVGEMSVSDLFILAVLPLVMLRHPERLCRRPVPTILRLGLLWLAAQIFTDMIRGASSQDYLRGWSKIALLLINFTVVWIVACRNRRRFLLYGAGLAIGTVLAFYVSPSSDAVISPWKFALGAPVTLLIMMWAPQLAPQRYLGILLPAIAMTTVHAFEDCRGFAVITFAAAIYSVFQMSEARRASRMGRSRLLILAATVVCGIWGFTHLYAHYAEQGIFGEYAERKMAAQSSGEGGLLLGGRGEILASSQAIIDSPLLGHGSWARDPIYAALLTQRRADLGYKELDHGPGPRDDLIPTHSHIFGAWVEAGLAGGMFWLFEVGFTVHTLLQAGGSTARLPVFAFAGFLLLWDIFFSPLGMPTRYSSPYFMAAMVALSSQNLSPKEF